MYPLLRRFVNARRVVVRCAPDMATDDARDAVVVRFNEDRRGPAQIWATTFYTETEPTPPPEAALIVQTVPNAKVAHWWPEGMRHDDLPPERDFGGDRKRYVGDLPIEAVHDVHWRQLAAALPIYPLSGLVMLAMLQYTSMASCEIFGMDFYSSQPRSTFQAGLGKSYYPARPYFAMHDYLTALDWLERLLYADRRYRWMSSRSLADIRAHWRSYLTEAD